MKKCKYCKQEIDKNAKVCQYCKRKQVNSINKIVYILIGFILICIGMSTISNETNNETNDNNSSKDENQCYITIEKFNQINIGMTYEEVKNIIGCDGNLSTETAVENQTLKIYGWYAKNKVSNATFSFTNDVLSGKSQIGLE